MNILTKRIRTGCLFAASLTEFLVIDHVEQASGN